MHKTGNCMLDAMRKRRSIWWPSGGLCIRTAVLCIACTQAWASVLGLGIYIYAKRGFYAQADARLMLNRCSSGCSAEKMG